jgi:hypothetical protein
MAPRQHYAELNLMLAPASYGNDSFVEILQPTRGYSLSVVRLDVPNPTTAIFKAKLRGPEDARVWTRAWLSTEAGTLAESASPELKVGDEVTLQVTLESRESPQYAYMRIESAPLATEHVVAAKLT